MDDKCKIIEYVKTIMYDCLDKEQMKKLDSTLITILDRYDVSEKTTEVALYDDTNEKVLLFFSGILKMQAKSEP